MNDMSGGPRKQSTKFNIEKLKSQDASEIKKVAQKFNYLSQRQKDLIRFQASEAYNAIVALAGAAQHSQETGYKFQGHNSNNAFNANRDTFNSYYSGRDKKDSFDATDRLHERSTLAGERMNSDNNSTYKVMGAMVTIAAVAASVAWAVVAGGSSKK